MSQGLTLDFEGLRCVVDGRWVELTLTEFRILRVLTRWQHQVLSREAIIDFAWGPQVHVSLRTVDSHVNSIRTKLGPYGRCIVTMYGVGYRWREVP